MSNQVMISLTPQELRDLVNALSYYLPTIPEHLLVDRTAVRELKDRLLKRLRVFEGN